MLSEKAKDALRIAIANNDESDEIIAELEKLEAMADVLEISTIDAIDVATTQALVNECKAKINEILQALA